MWENPCTVEMNEYIFNQQNVWSEVGSEGKGAFQTNATDKKLYCAVRNTDCKSLYTIHFSSKNPLVLQNYNIYYKNYQIYTRSC